MPIDNHCVAVFVLHALSFLISCLLYFCMFSLVFKQYLSLKSWYSVEYINTAGKLMFYFTGSCVSSSWVFTPAHQCGSIQLNSLKSHCEIVKENHRNCLWEVYLGCSNKWGNTFYSCVTAGVFLVSQMCANIFKISFSEHEPNIQITTVFIRFSFLNWCKGAVGRPCFHCQYSALHKNGLNILIINH